MFWKKHLFSIVFIMLLTGFTGYLLLDTFVIVRKYAVVEEPAVSIVSSNEAFSSEQEEVSDAVQLVSQPTVQKPDENRSEPISTDTTYQDDNIRVALQEYRVNDTTVYVADVTLSSAEYLQTAFAQNTYGRNVTDKTSAIADSVNAVLAINGDYYGAQQSGYVIRNGVLYRSSASRNAEDLVIYRDGSFAIVSESDVTAQELLDAGAWNVLSFGPALVTDGDIAVSVTDEVGRAKASNPRTAIGIIDELHYVFVVSDGRTEESEGLSLYELAELMQQLGVQTAYNLDGGGSSSMVFLGVLINNPTTNGKRISERSVSDIVYIGYAENT